MDENEELEGGNEKIEIEKNIIDSYSSIKEIADSAISLLNKSGEYAEEEFEEFFGLTEQIQEKIEEIRDMLGELA
jgi:hypothetical protein